MEAKKIETLSGVQNRAPADPPERSWPRLKAGLELLERNNHEAAALHFGQLAASGALQGDEAAMAIYFQADALYALGRLREAEVLYRKFLELPGSLPSADNARSALEYIAHAEEYRKALAAKGKP